MTEKTEEKKPEVPPPVKTLLPPRHEEEDDEDDVVVYCSIVRELAGGVAPPMRMGDYLRKLREENRPKTTLEKAAEKAAFKAPQTKEPPIQDLPGAWLLPFVPARGSDVSVRPDGRALLETGLRMILPEDVVCRISFPIYNGRPGILIPCLELDYRAAEYEIIIPVRCEAGRDNLIIRPGDYRAVARFEKVGVGLIDVGIQPERD